MSDDNSYAFKSADNPSSEVIAVDTFLRDRFANWDFNLTKIELIDCNLDRLPGDFGRLALLKDCRLSGNNFIQVPAVLVKNQRLETLLMSRNQVQFVPCFVDALENLKHLDLYGNYVAYVECNLERLESLDLEMNYMYGPSACYQYDEKVDSLRSIFDCVDRAFQRRSTSRSGSESSYCASEDKFYPYNSDDSWEPDVTVERRVRLPQIRNQRQFIDTSCEIGQYDDADSETEAS